MIHEGLTILVDDDRFPLDGEETVSRKVRVRTLGCYPLTGAIESEASTVEEVVAEMLLTTTSEWQGQPIDRGAGAASIEKKKHEGYFDGRGAWITNALEAVKPAYDGDIPDDRQHIDTGAQAGCDRKKGGRDHCLGRSRGGLTTKIHAVVDRQGLPVRLSLTPGQAHDAPAALNLLDRLDPRTIMLPTRPMTQGASAT